MSIQFYTEDIDFKFSGARKTTSWIKKVIESEGASLLSITYIFCSDSYLLNINTDFLAHHTYTDIVTFDNSEEPGKIEADIFISIERVQENAIKFKVSFEEELHRVIIHGVLHLLGYKDKSASQKSLMRKKEDSYLSLR